MPEELSPQQRMQMFASATRQNFQMLPRKSGASGDVITLDIPKVRLTSKIRLMVEATLTVTHASATDYNPAPFAPFSLLRKVQVDMNNGFSPFVLSGPQLYLYSLMRDNAAILTPATSGRAKVVQGLVASSGGTANTIRFVADLPLTLNDRDPIGLIVTQNQETTVTVTVDIDTAAKLSSDTTGYTFALSNVTITPMVESFSIPSIPQAMPNVSVLKLVQANKEAINAGGVHNFKLPTGQTYRKFAFLLEDASGVGLTDAEITGDIEIVFNQADTPYRINPKMLAAINHEMFGNTLPAGVWAFDLSYQGLSNYGAGRDYIDTEKLTEFWIRVNPAKSGTMTVVSETLSRLR